MNHDRVHLFQFPPMIMVNVKMREEPLFPSFISELSSVLS